MIFLYPRLDTSTALGQLAQLKRLAPTESPTVAMQHPKMEFAATGGQRVDVNHLQALRHAVMQDLASVPEGAVGQFDAVLGQSLAKHLEISRSEAAHEQPWTFLTLMVFPDVLLARFPDLTEARALGRPRNVLRRVWTIEQLIGFQLPGTVKPLSQDEYLNILERSALARVPNLARLVALELVRLEVPQRDFLTRHLLKRLTMDGGPLDLSLLSFGDLQAHVRQRLSEALRLGPATWGRSQRE